MLPRPLPQQLAESQLPAAAGAANINGTSNDDGNDHHVCILLTVSTATGSSSEDYLPDVDWLEKRLYGQSEL